MVTVTALHWLRYTWHTHAALKDTAHPTDSVKVANLFAGGTCLVIATSVEKAIWGDGTTLDALPIMSILDFHYQL